DTIVHDRPALEFLVSSIGASRVLLGSDYPFDMGTLDCVRQVRALSLAEPDKATVLGGAVRELLDKVAKGFWRRAGLGRTGGGNALGILHHAGASHASRLEHDAARGPRGNHPRRQARFLRCLHGRAPH